MILRDLISKYELGWDGDDGLVGLNVDWFMDNGFNLGNVCKFVRRLKDYLVEGFVGIYDFIGDYERFIYSVEFYMNLFWILYELEFDYLYKKIIGYLEDVIEIVKDNEDWDLVEDKLDYIRYELVDCIR